MHCVFHPSRRAFTLIEALAVVVVLAMASGVTVVALAAFDGEARLQRLGFEWSALDAQGRALARLRPPGAAAVRLRHDDDPRSIRLDAGDFGADWPQHEIRLPADVRATIELRDGQSVATVLFDRRGCSIDYRLAVEIDGNGKSWVVNGLTGLIEEEQVGGGGA